mgnify:CR=1 FL=1
MFQCLIYIKGMNKTYCLRFVEFKHMVMIDEKVAKAYVLMSKIYIKGMNKTYRLRFVMFKHMVMIDEKVAEAYASMSKIYKGHE